jgi:DNA-binding NarL/FixJ family response regulator
VTAAHCGQPDVCLIGLELPGGAIEAIRGVCERAPNAAVIVLSANHDVDDLLAVIRAGAIGYLSATADPDVLRRVVRAVAAGEAVIPRTLVLDLVHELQGAAPGASGLTPREAQVLGMLRRGQSTAAIAERLAISPVTVRRHISALVHKAGAEDRSALSADGAPSP